jgi:hypothetical protein
MDNNGWCFVCSVTFVTSLLLGVLVGGYVFEGLANNRWQDEIESRGCAEYYLDENHEPQWRWTVEPVEKEGE